VGAYFAALDHALLLLDARPLRTLTFQRGRVIADGVLPLL
jgi:hypothetical protein